MLSKHLLRNDAALIIFKEYEKIWPQEFVVHLILLFLVFLTAKFHSLLHFLLGDVLIKDRFLTLFYPIIDPWHRKYSQPFPKALHNVVQLVLILSMVVSVSII